MSVLINEKLHSHRLKWRWPLSRQVTLSIGTLAVLLTVWWAVAACCQRNGTNIPDYLTVKNRIKQPHKADKRQNNPKPPDAVA